MLRTRFAGLPELRPETEVWLVDALQVCARGERSRRLAEILHDLRRNDHGRQLAPYDCGWQWIGSSEEPPLTQIVSAPTVDAADKRVPQSGRTHSRALWSKLLRYRLRPARVSIPNRTVRSLFLPPERRFFKPDPLRLPSNPLNFLAFNIRTKTAVVRLLRRKRAEKDVKRPELGVGAATRGSDKWPERARFCGILTADQVRKRMSRLGVLAEGEVLSSNPLQAFFNGLRTTQIAVDVAWRIHNPLWRSPLDMRHSRPVMQHFLTHIIAKRAAEPHAKASRPVDYPALSRAMTCCRS